MGVLGLETFMECSMPNEYCYEVNIKDLADKYINETGRQPEVLIDGPNCLRKLYDRTDKHWILGGQLNEFVETTKKLVTAFKNAGIQPHLYFGNATQTVRRENWIHRRNTDIKRVVEIFTKIEKRSDYSWEYLMPPIIGAMGRFAPKFECDCDVTVTVEEPVEYIAKYAWEHQSFAILSQDTSFVLMKGAKYYFSLKHLNFDTLTTVTYSRDGLMRALDLEHHELVHLAPLIGTELIPLRTLNNFHNKLCPGQTVKFTDILEVLPCVVKYIKERNIPNNGNYQYLERISVDIYGTKEMVNIIETCIRRYMNNSKETHNNDPDSSVKSDVNWMKILQRANEKNLNCEVPAHLYPLMLGDDYELSTSLEDYSNDKLLPTAKLYLPLRERIYGVLLFEKPNVSHVKEWCIEGMDCPTEPSEVQIKQIKDIETIHPGLLKLWSDNCPDDKRWRLFVENLTDKTKLDATKLKNLGFPFAIPVAVLFYVLQENGKLLTETEIDVLLIQAATVKFYSAVDIKNMESQLHSGSGFIKRAVEISTIFLRGVAIVLFLLAACGFPLNKGMPWLYFDGKLLLEKYIQATKGRRRLKQLCEDKDEIYQLYKKMKDLVMPPKSWRH